MTNECGTIYGVRKENRTCIPGDKELCSKNNTVRQFNCSKTIECTSSSQKGMDPFKQIYFIFPYNMSPSNILTMYLHFYLIYYVIPVDTTSKAPELNTGNTSSHEVNGKTGDLGTATNAAPTETPNGSGNGETKVTEGEDGGKKQRENSFKNKYDSSLT